jgi:hypothetical protein
VADPKPRFVGAEPFVVFLDTEVFAAQQFNLQSEKFVKLFEYVRRRRIQIVTTDVVREEVRSRLDEWIRDAESGIGKLQRAARAHGQAGIDVDQLRRSMTDAFDNLLRDVLVIEATGRSGEGPFRRYFDHLPPFDRRKNKCEFPDAFNLEALIEWSNQNHLHVHVVTQDGGVGAACEAEGCLSAFTSLEAVLDALIDGEGVSNLAESVRSWVLAHPDRVIRPLTAVDLVVEKVMEVAGYAVHTPQIMLRSDIRDVDVVSVSERDARVSFLVTAEVSGGAYEPGRGLVQELRDARVDVALVAAPDGWEPIYPSIWTTLL